MRQDIRATLAWVDLTKAKQASLVLDALDVVLSAIPVGETYGTSQVSYAVVDELGLSKHDAKAVGRTLIALGDQVPECTKGAPARFMGNVSYPRIWAHREPKGDVNPIDEWTIAVGEFDHEKA